jgi:hypothetical protein
VDQRVDLVQVSADSRSLLDMQRQRATEKLTGMQANYFGAFGDASAPPAGSRNACSIRGDASPLTASSKPSKRSGGSDLARTTACNQTKSTRRWAS